MAFLMRAPKCVVALVVALCCAAPFERVQAADLISLKGVGVAPLMKPFSTRSEAGAYAFAGLAALGLFVAPRVLHAIEGREPQDRVWDGFYLGGSAGVGRIDGETARNATIPQIASWFTIGATVLGVRDPKAGAVDARLGPTTALVGGFYGGYQRALAARFVAGVEVDWQASLGRQPGTLAQEAVQFAPIGVQEWRAVAIGRRVEQFGSLRARFGVLAAPDVLLFATAGAAFGDVSLVMNSAAATTGGAVAPPVAGHASRLRGGLALGGGAEWMFAQNWSARVEYLTYRFGAISSSATVGVFDASGALVAAIPSGARAHANINVARVGLAYRFD